MNNFPASGRPAPGAQLTNPNSETPLTNSQTPVVKLIPTGRDPSSQVFSHRARPANFRATFGIKTAENSQIFLHLSLDRSWSEGIYTRPGCLLTSRRIRKGGNAWFFTRDTHPSEAPAAGVVCLAAAALAAVTCCADQTPKLPVLIIN